MLAKYTLTLALLQILGLSSCAPDGEASLSWTFQCFLRRYTEVNILFFSSAIEWWEILWLVSESEEPSPEVHLIHLKHLDILTQQLQAWWHLQVMLSCNPCVSCANLMFCVVTSGFFSPIIRPWINATKNRWFGEKTQRNCRRTLFSRSMMY